MALSVQTSKRCTIYCWLGIVFCSSLEVIPGFQTSILQYEQDVLLEIDIAHKILRTNTVLEVMYDLYHTDNRGFHNNAMKQIVGSIVMTRYALSLSFVSCTSFAVVFIVQLMAKFMALLFSTQNNARWQLYNWTLLYQVIVQNCEWVAKVVLGQGARLEGQEDDW